MAQNQAYKEIKAGVSGLAGDAPSPDDLPEAPEAPVAETVIEAPISEAEPSLSPSPVEISPAPEGQLDMERFHEIAEAIVNERWEEFLGKVGDLTIWKEKVDMNLLAIKQELLRTQERFAQLQTALVGKVREYDIDMKDVHTEMKALEKVLEKITEPLVLNIKELNRITADLKQIRR
ncbi:hypothetical protein HZB00_00725 [Candidatus Woesearchaeota archaeon]|nr:hypothetical protein [Candidatus Woesearchaeota archaeon]